MYRSFIAMIVAVSLCLIQACSGPHPSPAKETATQHEIDPRDPPSITRWEGSESNVWRSKIEVVDLACFRDKMTEKGHSEAKPVPVEFCNALDSGITAEQRTALQSFRETEAELYSKVRAAIYADYRRSYSASKEGWSLGASIFNGDQADTEAVLPKIVKGDELDGLVSFGKLYILRPKDGVVRVGLVLYCPWDEEHGMGVVIANGEVERVGDSGVVYLQLTTGSYSEPNEKKGNG
jgi:hypothetical protein